MASEEEVRNAMAAAGIKVEFTPTGGMKLTAPDLQPELLAAMGCQSHTFDEYRGAVGLTPRQHSQLDAVNDELARVVKAAGGGKQ